MNGQNVSGNTLTTFNDLSIFYTFILLWEDKEENI